MLDAARFLLRFVAWFAALQAGYYALPDDWLREVFVQNVVAAPVAALLHAVSNSAVVATGGALHGMAHSLFIVRGCDGTGAILLSSAALLATRVSWRVRLPAIVIGGLLLYAMNLVRIAVLFETMQGSMPLFNAVHGVLAPTFTVLVTCAIYAWCMDHPAAAEQRNA